MVGSQDDSTNFRLRRTPPLFPPSVWKVHEATLNDGHRTNNICEGCNNKFIKMVGHHHPSVWGAGRSSEVERSLMVRWVVGPIELFLVPASAPRLV